MKITTKTGLLILSVPVLLFAVGVIGSKLFSNYPESAPNNACINQLRLIDGAKRLWASENHRTNGPVAWNDILHYLSREKIPQCPKGGSYTLGGIGQLPTCTVEGHKLD